MPTKYYGPFRWRGRINWKDVTERVIASFLAGAVAGVAFYLMQAVFG